MNYQIEFTGKIKKDIKLAQKRGLNILTGKPVRGGATPHPPLTPVW